MSVFIMTVVRRVVMLAPPWLGMVYQHGATVHQSVVRGLHDIFIDVMVAHSSERPA